MKNEHYFSSKPSSKIRKYEVEIAINNSVFKFITSSGVFSPKKVDLGTRVLLKNAKIPKKGIIADLGCGYGIIGIIISKFHPNLTESSYPRYRQ